MITFKQIEALFWIAELGNFATAARKLNTTQSAISKRIRELENLFDVEIFDRSKRSARLTEKGEELLHYAHEMLECRDRVLERISSKDVLVRFFRLGVTELTALTWLPALVDEIRTNYPRLIIEPEVELSAILFDRLMDGTIDMIIVPDVFEATQCVTTPLRSVENAWMCTPALAEETLGEDSAKPIALARIAGFTVLAQGNLSGTGRIYGRWLTQGRVGATKSIISNNLIAQVGLAVSGLGVSYLPLRALRPLIDRGLLRTIETTPRLPRVCYAAMYRADRPSRLCAEIASYAARHCNFSRMLLGGWQ
jgi:DNA-binding transcriptional LysR family regulator